MKIATFILIIVYTGILTAQESQKDVLEQISILYKKNDSLLNQQLDTDLKLEKLNKSNIKLSESLTILRNEISSIEDQNLTNKKNTKTGAYILLFGLFLEVLGVIFLASDSLSKETQKIRPVKIEYTVANFGGNRTLELEIVTLQIIGTIFLILGFAFQFIGTLLVLTSDSLIMILGISVILLGIFIFSAIVVKQIGKENIFRKLRITSQNIKGILMFRLEKKFHKEKRVVCESCYKTLSISESIIQYLKPIQMDSLNCPRHFHIGHEKCIDPIFEVNRKHPNEKFDIISESLSSFYTSDFEEIQDLLKEKTEKHGDWDDEFKQTINRLEQIKKYYG